jgi:hypothetical protein
MGEKIKVTFDDTWVLVGAIALCFIANYLGHILVCLERIADVMEKLPK